MINTEANNLVRFIEAVSDMGVQLFDAEVEGFIVDSRKLGISEL